MDREKVIKGLECCSIPQGHCEKCPYETEGFVAECTSELAKDALALIKEQEKDLKHIGETLEELLADYSLTKILYGDQGKIVGELVRCKDCIHYRYYGLSEETVSECRIDHCENPDKEWFCADGERQEGQ